MELTGKLKDKMAKAKDKDEAKKIMENAGMKLTDDELDTVAGGWGDWLVLPQFRKFSSDFDTPDYLRPN